MTDAVTAAYRLLFNRALTKVDAEKAHHGAASLITLAGKVAPLRMALSAATRPRANSAPREISRRTELFGRTLSGPVGLAAGFDKNATMAAGLDALGFAFVEVGTVTAHPQPGNDRPRLMRLVQERSLVNRMGFNNDGARVVAGRLRALRQTPAGRRMVLGVNIGKSKVTPAASAQQDYAFSAKLLAPFADYLVVNVSSPNTPGLRDLQQVRSLAPILRGVRDAAAAGAAREVPVLVKIAPDLADDDVDAVADLVTELGLAGVVAANTTIKHNHGAGGLSGPVLMERGVQIVARLRQRLGAGAVIIGVGGITTRRDVNTYLKAGANAVQAYTQFVYEGPSWPARLNG